MPNAMIEIKNLTFAYAKSKINCIDIESFVVNKGERVFLYGPSGSGKSTLLGILGGVLVADAQHENASPANENACVVSLMDNNLTTMKPHARDKFRADHIGFLFQQFNLIPYLSVFDNVLLPCKFSAKRAANAVATGNTLHQEVERLLLKLDLQPALFNRPVTQLSVGQQQRVAAARALIGKPEIIIADEPTSALDADRQAIFLELLLQESAASNATLLFVSHDRRLANTFDREINLSELNRAVLEVETS